MINLVEALEAVQKAGCGFVMSDSQGKPPYIIDVYKYGIDGERLSFHIIKDTLGEIIKALIDGDRISSQQLQVEPPKSKE